MQKQAAARWVPACRVHCSIMHTCRAEEAVTVGSGCTIEARDKTRAHRCTRILPILMPLQQARSAFSIDSPLRMMLTPHSFLAKSTPM